MVGVEEVLGIGEFAKATGLPVSALRHYDEAGVLVPAAVDPSTRYRSYAPGQVAAGRVVAALRSLGAPLSVMADVVSTLDSPRAAHDTLDAYWRSVESRVHGAKALLARAHSLIDQKERAVRAAVTVDGPRLAEAIRRVAPVAARRDKKAPAIEGVLLESGPARLRLVATDRVRLAWDDVPAAASSSGSPRATRVEVVVPAAFLLSMADAVAELDRVVIEVVDGRVEVQGIDACDAIDGPFPPYQSFIPSVGSVRAVFDGAALSETLASRSECRYVLASPEPGRVAMRGVKDPWTGGVDAVVEGGGFEVGLDADVLHDSLELLPGGQLLMSIDGPYLPVLFQPADRADCGVVVMPIKIAG